MCDLGLSMSLSEVPDYTARSSKCIEQDSQIHTSMDESDLRRKYIDHSRFPCDDLFVGQYLVVAMCDPEFSMSLSEVPDYTARSS